MRRNPVRQFCFVLLVMLPASRAHTQTAGGGPDAGKQEAFAWVDENRRELWRLSRFIWANPEVGLEEYQASDALIEQLEANGFTVQRGVADMPTAFVASYGAGEPVIAILAEFDALPGMSQRALPMKIEREYRGNGHACGHSVYGVASVGGAIAARHVMETHGLPGTLRLYGTPAEETGIGKSYMAGDGLFDDCAVALHWHPGDKTRVSYSLSKAVVSVKYTFKGLAAHASKSPHEGRSALDAVELMNVGANYLREHLKDDARIHYVITDGGGQPNVVPPTAQVWYYLRADDHADVESMFRRMRKIAEGAALMTDTDFSVDVQSDSYELLPNEPLSRVIQRNLELVGAPQFSEEEIRFARKTQAPLLSERSPEFDKGLSDGVEPFPDEFEPARASTDVGNVSWRVPTSGFRTACYTYGAPGHSWQIVACTGMTIGEKGLNCAAKVMAATALDLLTNPHEIEAARRNFEQRRSGEAPRSLIPDGQRPPSAIR